MLGAVATLGLGGAMGLEGSSIYSGHVGRGAGSGPCRAGWLGAPERRVLLVAGAAAGVAAIFKAPATGAVFALEVPYQDDLARHMLLPSLVGAATGYLTFAAFHGTAPLFESPTRCPFSYTRPDRRHRPRPPGRPRGPAFARALRWAKAWLGHLPRPGSGCRSPAAAARRACPDLDWACGAPLSFGPGYSALTWALDPNRALWAVAVLLVVRCLATTAAIGGGGVGGLFIPLVVAGALHRTPRRRGAPRRSTTTLFAVIGVAAFLGAGYRVPLAAVMFVAETTGQPGLRRPRPARRGGRRAGDGPRRR